MKQKQVSKQWP